MFLGYKKLLIAVVLGGTLHATDPVTPCADDPIAQRIEHLLVDIKEQLSPESEPVFNIFYRMATASDQVTLCSPVFNHFMQHFRYDSRNQNENDEILRSFMLEYYLVKGIFLPLAYRLHQSALPGQDNQFGELENILSILQGELAIPMNDLNESRYIYQRPDLLVQARDYIMPQAEAMRNRMMSFINRSRRRER